MFDIYFLHTGQVHVGNFDAISKAFADQSHQTLHIGHRVEEEYLSYAQQFGCDDSLRERMLTTLSQMSKQARLVVCTCSSIGGIAEWAANEYGHPIQRIDRAMANRAVLHEHILVLATLESTLEPTLQLISQSAQSASTKPKISSYVVDQAFALFMQGDQDASLAKIQQQIIAQQSRFDAIVLAQASMAGAAAHQLYKVPVYSSPMLGVARAIKSLSQ